jgi:DNA-binding ferritin-like protein (Dps family)
LRIPQKPLSWMKWPRDLSDNEKELFRRVFEEKIKDLDLNHYDYYNDFRKYCLVWSFDDWNSAKKCLRKVIKAIKSGGNTLY